MTRCLLVIDAGGTNFKFALASPQGSLISPCTQFPAHSDGSANEINNTYRSLALAAVDSAASYGNTIAEVCISTPGPFDFTRGCSLMRHKFASIYGLPIAPLILDILFCKKIDFLHDSTAFLLGEAAQGAGRGASSPACLTLGTGLGFACMQNGHVLVNQKRGPVIFLWNAPFRGGIAEDHISSRAIHTRYAKLSGISDPPDVRRIAEAARAGDVAAVQTFRETGEALGELMKPILARLGADRLILGGQIARSADLFIDAVQDALPCEVVPCMYPDKAALLGAAHFLISGKAAGTEQIGELQLLYKTSSV
jgi:glucokinase